MQGKPRMKAKINAELDPETGVTKAIVMGDNVALCTLVGVVVKAAGGGDNPCRRLFLWLPCRPENTPRPEAGKSPGSGPAEGQAPTTDRGPFSCGQPDAKGRLSAMAMADALKKFTASARSMSL